MSCHSPSVLEATSFTIPGLTFWICVVLHLHIQTYIHMCIYICTKEISLLFSLQSHLFHKTEEDQVASKTIKCFEFSTIPFFFLLQGKKKKKAFAIHIFVWTDSTRCNSHCTCYYHSDHRQGLGNAVWEVHRLEGQPEVFRTVSAGWHARTLDILLHSGKLNYFYTKL